MKVLGKISELNIYRLWCSLKAQRSSNFHERTYYYHYYYYYYFETGSSGCKCELHSIHGKFNISILNNGFILKILHQKNFPKKSKKIWNFLHKKVCSLMEKIFVGKFQRYHNLCSSCQVTTPSISCPSSSTTNTNY